MKVKDLIDMLKEFDSEAIIVQECGGDCDGFFEPNCVVSDIACLDCNPNRSFYGGPHLMKRDVDSKLGYEFIEESAKEEMRNAKQVKCCYLGEYLR